MVDKAANQQVTLSVGEIKWCWASHVVCEAADAVDWGEREGFGVRGGVTP